MLADRPPLIIAQDRGQRSQGHHTSAQGYHMRPSWATCNFCFFVGIYRGDLAQELPTQGQKSAQGHPRKRPSCETCAQELLAQVSLASGHRCQDRAQTLRATLAAILPARGSRPVPRATLARPPLPRRCLVPRACAATTAQALLADLPTRRPGVATHERTLVTSYHPRGHLVLYYTPCTILHILYYK